MIVRPEVSQDGPAIRRVVSEAFANAELSSGTEAAIVDALRNSGKLSVSLVAIDNAQVVGHVAFSPVLINGMDAGWFGLGPVSVSPASQRRGIGRCLVAEGLARLRDRSARGCVVLGDPAYYGTFGFLSDPKLRYPGVPQEYFQRLAFGETVPVGDVSYSEAFDVS